MSHFVTNARNERQTQSDEVTATPPDDLARSVGAATFRSRRSGTHLIDVAVATIAAVPAVYLAAVIAKGFADRFVRFGYGSSSEFRASGVDHYGISKNSELVFTFLLWPVLAGFAAVLDRRYRRLGGATVWERGVARALAIPAIAVLIPVVTGIGSAPVVGIVRDPLLFAVWLQLPVAVACLVRALRLRFARATADDSMAVVWLAMAAAPAGLGVAVAAQVLTRPGGLSAGAATVTAVGVTIALAVACGLAFELPSSARLRVLPAAFAAFGVASLPLLLPPLLRGEQGLAFPPGLDGHVWAATLVAIAVAVAVAVALAVRRSVRSGRVVVSSIVVAALLVPMRVAYTIPWIRPDDYHFGEYISPFVLWHTFGQAPMVDIVLPRGMLLNVVPQFLNSALNDGSAAAFPYTRPMVALIVCAAAHFLLRRSLGIMPATAIVSLMALSDGSVDGDLLGGAIIVWSIFVLVSRRPPVASGAVLAVAAATAVLAYPMMGIVNLGTLAGVAVAGILGAALARDVDALRRFSKGVLGFGGVVAVIAVTPMRGYVLAGIEYVTSNAGSNAHAWGIPIELLWTQTPLGLGQLIQTGFALGFAVSAIIMFRRRREMVRPSSPRYTQLAIVAVPAVVAIVLSSRYMGRIDIESWPNRAISGTLFVVGLIVPSMLMLEGRASYRRVGWAMIGCAGLLAAIWHPVGQGGAFVSARGEIARPATWASETAASVMPRIGIGDDTADHLNTLLSIWQVSNKLDAGQPVLNLSNQGALFAYMGWSDPISYLAPFNIESAAEEKRVLGEAIAASPQYVFLAPGQSFDYSPLMLRDPSLSRWLVDNYTPFVCGGTTWATAGVGASWTGIGALVCPEVVGKPTTEDSAVLWAKTIGAYGDVGMLPATWSADKDQLAAGTTLRVNRVSIGDPFSTFDVETTALAENWQGLVVVKSTCTSGDSTPTELADAASQATRAYLMWPSRKGLEPFSEAIFTWGAGTFVVPVDAYPVWALRVPAAPLVLTVPRTGCSGSWEITARAVSR